MRIAIIGGRGLIGFALAQELRSAGHEPLLLSRKAEGSHAIQGIPLAAWDGRNAAELAAILDGMDGLVNLAGESLGKSRWTKKRMKVLLDSRLVPSRAVEQAWSIMKSPPRVLIQASAIGIYRPSDQPTDEQSPLGDGFGADLCKNWEISTLGVTRHQTRHVIIRSGLVLERKRGILPQMMLPFRLFAGGPIGPGSQWITWIHVADESRAIRYFLENDKAAGAYNLTSPSPVTNANFGKAIAKALHRPYWFWIPGFLLKLVLGDMSSLLLEDKRVIPRRLLDEGFNFLYPDLPTALAELLDSNH